ncbi:MAG: efflux RND transporter permease subunit [Hyphomicrobium sp.]|nr:efflux RND transporter permease subunit [Hyphomicrobium sp.]
MEALTRFSIERWRLTLTAIVLVLVTGTYTYLRQPSQEDPEIIIRTAVVTVAFPGMSASRVEQLLIKPVEEAVKQIPEADTVRSSAQTGLATVKVELLPTVINTRPIWDNLRNKMADLAPSLPAGTVGPLVNDDYGRVAVTTLALTGADFSMAELRAQARWLRDRLSTLSLISRIDLFGVQDERIWLSFDRTRLSQLGLSSTQVLNAIAEQNQILPAGSLITEDGMRYSLEPSGDFRSVDAIGDVPVSTPSGAVVYVRDIVKVERGYVDPPRKPVLFNGQPAVALALSMVPNVPIKDFGVETTAALENLRQDLPLGMNLSVVTDQSPIVASAVAEATSNLGQTLLTVLAVVMLFLGVRAGAIVGTIVPLSIFLALVGMLLWDIPLHRISIAAIIIALGLLVDNGVVIAEDIKKRIDGGAERVAAALAATRTLAIPLLTSSLTTILAFLPLLLAPDAAGEFLRALAQVIILTLLASWLLSCTVTPLLCVWFLPSGRQETQSSDITQRFTASYGHWLGWLLRHSYSVVAGAIVLFAISIAALGRVPTGLLPPSERAQFVVRLELPAGANEAETLRVTERLARFLADESANPDVASNVFYVGAGGPRFFLALSPVDSAPHVAFGVVNTGDSSSVAAARARLEEFLAAQIPEGRGWTELLFLGQEPPGTLEIRLSGLDIDTLYQRGKHIEDLLASVPGTKDLRTDWANPVLQIDVLIDQERTRRAGLSPAATARALEANFDGTQVTDYREGDRIIPIVLRAREADRSTLDDLADVTIANDRGQPIPLLQVATLAGELKPYIIHRYNLDRTITISGINPDLTAQQLLDRVKPLLNSLDLPAGYRWAAGGEVEASQKANGALFLYMPHCLVAIVVLLIWQFNSFRRTAIIILTIPLVVIGASLGLNLSAAKLDFNAMLGLLALAGIIVNNAIVLIERIDEERLTTTNLGSAVTIAAQARFRPIVMTTLTTIVGLVPLYLLGGELWRGMTVVMMFGLGIGTILTLVVVPILYLMLFSPWQRSLQPAVTAEHTA